MNNNIDSVHLYIQCFWRFDLFWLIFLSCQEIGNKPETPVLLLHYKSLAQGLTNGPLWKFTRRQAAVQRWLMLPLSKRGISVLYIVLLHPSNVSLSIHTEFSNRLYLPDLWKVVMCTLQKKNKTNKKKKQCTFAERDDARLLLDLFVPHKEKTQK